MWPVKVLLWKHSLMRIRRYIRTFFDYFSPLLYFALIHLLTAPSKVGRHENVHYTEPISYEYLLDQQTGVQLLYTPETVLTNQLMDEVGAKLKLTRLDHLPGEKEKGFYPFPNATALSILEYSKEMHDDDTILAIVIFENMDSDTWPKKLNYTIRMKTNFMTNKYETSDPFDVGHHEYFGMQYETFMCLQWTLDTSYLRLLTGANVDQKLTLQEFPFAADNSDTNAANTCIVASFLLPFALTLTFIFLTGRLFEEKNSGMHELVKMVGVSWEELSISHVLDLAPHLLLYAVGGALFFKLDGLIANSCGGYIAAALALHFLTVVGLAFVTVYIFNMNQYLELVTMAVYTSFLVGSMLAQRVKSRALSLLCCLLPHDPFMRFWRALGAREMFGGGITISNMWSRNPTEQISVAEMYLFMVLQVLLFSVIAWYLSRVRPGRYGQALPWKFPFSKEYWFMQPKVEAAPEEAHFVCGAEQRYFEKAPAGLPVGIQINDVSKTYNKDRVLHGVDLTVYRGEITVLLGHNGAGKTTLINIITGLISATSGRVLVEGMDTVKQAKDVRKLIGLCPQENIFFPNFTVLEHTMFFAMLKGQSYSESRTSATALFSKLQLSGKADALPAALSGGMRRRTQLACAVAGGSRVLVLDEPTSGLDVETRRELWDLLLSLRGDRTVLLTTHFMEEADALGDRIAALHHGRVKCHATSMFLKRAIGTGYRLSLTTIGGPLEPAISAAIAAVVPAAAVREQRPGGVSYNLPAKDTARFPALFAALEDARSALKIDTIGVGKSTLDEVFVELCSDEKPTFTEEPEPSSEPKLGRLTGAGLWARQLAVLLARQWRYVTSHLIAFVGMIAFVTLLLWAFTEVANNNPFGMDQEEKPNADVALNLDLYAARSQRRAFVNVDKDTLETLRRGYSGVQFEEVADVVEAVLQIGKANIQEYNKYLIGIELNDTHAKALYTTTVRHAAPVALNVLTNALAARLLAGAEPRSLTARNYPLRGMVYQDAKLKLPKGDQRILVWACNIAMVVLFYLCTFSRLPCAERAAGTRHALVLAGAPRALAWAATLLAQALQVLLACVIPVAILAAAVDRDGTFNQPGFIWSLCVLLTLGSLAFLGLVYLVSTLAAQSAASAVLAISAFIFSQITPNVPEAAAFYYKLLTIPYILMPPHTLTAGLVQLATVAQLNGHCNLNRDKCPALYGPGAFEPAKCCESSPGSEPWSYWVTHDAAGWPMLILAGQALAYFILTHLSDSGALERAWARALAALARYSSPPPRYRDSMARAEAAYVEKAIQLPKKQIPDAILCNNLEKNYPGWCRRKPFFAVKGISFSVKKGECFGLLGVNGAGKTSTFRMLTGQASPTGGDIFANGHHLCERGAYMRTFSYCPQFAGVDGFLSGRQSLALLLTLRGLQAADVAAITDSWLEEVGLTPAADKLVSSYSGGMARRLAAAAALSQPGSTALLDEPTAGVDPVARRRMHRAMLRARHRSLIIASHSMDEMEALCHRIAIMSGGELRALGSAAALKAQHAQGYSVVFKLSTAQDVTDGASKLAEFKGEVHSRFTCELQDSHQSMLSYQVKESLRYSELFSELEQLREQFPALVEDYTVTETTLEEVFLALAKEAREPAV